MARAIKAIGIARSFIYTGISNINNNNNIIKDIYMAHNAGASI